jgi:hypothetical protein
MFVTDSFGFSDDISDMMINSCQNSNDFDYLENLANRELENRKRKLEIKKENIRIIIRKDSNKEDFTFVSNDNILKDNNASATTTNNEKSQKINLMRELTKRFIQRNLSTKIERF